MKARSAEPQPTERLLGILSEYVSPIIARSVVQVALRRCGILEHGKRIELSAALVASVVGGLNLYVSDAARAECEVKLRHLIGERSVLGETLPLGRESDVVAARALARRLAVDAGFNHTDQVRVATAVSEIARNALSYAGGGEVWLEPLRWPKPGVRVRVRDSGPGIGNLAVILSGNYTSKTGLGLGIVGCKRLMDEFDVQTTPGAGTTVTMSKYMS